MSVIRVLPVLALGSLVLAQPATAPQRAGVTNTEGMSTMHLTTRVGSFKMIDGVGRVEISFTGSLLLSGLKGTRVVEGNVVRQYNQNNRELYFGKGRIVVTGNWRAIQWFGRDMRATWFGRGVVRLDGEFDTNLETGWYWYEDPKVRFAWPAEGTIDETNPSRRTQPDVRPERRPA